MNQSSTPQARGRQMASAGKKLWTELRSVGRAAAELMTRYPDVPSLQAYRYATGLSQDQAAVRYNEVTGHQTCLGGTSINAWESWARGCGRGSPPSLSSVLILCTAYGRGPLGTTDEHVSPTELLGDAIKRLPAEDRLSIEQLTRSRQHEPPVHPAKTATREHDSGAWPTAIDAVCAHIPALRRVLDAYDSPEDGPVHPVEQLRPAVTSIVNKRLRSDYSLLAAEVPPLLSELHRAMLDCSPTQRPDIARLLVQVYRAADAVANKYGYYDLSARIIGQLCATAAETGDELVLASGSYVRGETFFVSGDLASGRRMLERAADRIKAQNSERAAATYGTLHMRAAVMAARAGLAVLAREHIDEAQNVALRVNEGVHLGTAFGAASVRIHRLSLAVELGDVGAALRSVTGWQPPTGLPAERRSHFYIDLARAHHLADRPDSALEALHIARGIAPEHIRSHPHVRQIVEQMRLTGGCSHHAALHALQQAIN